MKPDINSPADLKGKTIASPQLGNTQDVALRTWLKNNGLSSDTSGGGDVSVKPQDNAATLDAFKQDQVQGAWVPEPWATRLVQEGGGKVLVDEKTLWPQGQFVTTHLIVSTKFLKDHPDVVKRLLEGQVAANDYVNKNPADAQKAANDQIEKITQKRLADGVVAAAWKNLTFTNDPIASSLKTSADNAIALDLLKPVDLSEHLRPRAAQRGAGGGGSARRHRRAAPQRGAEVEAGDDAVQAAARPAGSARARPGRGRGSTASPGDASRRSVSHPSTMAPRSNTIGNGRPALEVLVVVGGVGGQHEPARLGAHPHDLEAVGVTADEVDGQPVGQLVVAGVEHDPPVVHGADELGDVVDGERVVERRSGHVATGGERHLPVLEVEAGRREVADAAGVVVVQVGEDHVGDRRGVDADGGQRLGRRAQQTPAPAVGVVGSPKPVSTTHVASSPTTAHTK